MYYNEYGHQLSIRSSEKAVEKATASPDSAPILSSKDWGTIKEGLESGQEVFNTVAGLAAGVRATRISAAAAATAAVAKLLAEASEKMEQQAKEAEAK